MLFYVTADFVPRRGSAESQLILTHNGGPKLSCNERLHRNLRAIQASEVPIGSDLICRARAHASSLLEPSERAEYKVR